MIMHTNEVWLGRGDLTPMCSNVLYIVLLFQWLSKKVLGWLEVLYQSSSLDADSDDKTNLTNPIASNKERLAHNLYNVYAHR